MIASSPWCCHQDFPEGNLIHDIEDEVMSPRISKTALGCRVHIDRHLSEIPELSILHPVTIFVLNLDFAEDTNKALMTLDWNRPDDPSSEFTQLLKEMLQSTEISVMRCRPTRTTFT